MSSKLWKIAAVVAVLAVLVGAASIAYRQVENQKQELERNKATQAALDNSIVGRAKAKLAKNGWTSGVLTVSFDEASKTLMLVDESDPSAGLDQGLGKATPEQILQQTFNLFVRAGQGVFTVDGIDKLVVTRKVSLNVGNGIATSTEVARIGAPKDKFMAVDWESLEGQPIYQQIDDAADEYTLNNEFRRSIRNANALILSPN